MKSRSILHFIGTNLIVLAALAVFSVARAGSNSSQAETNIDTAESDVSAGKYDHAVALLKNQVDSLSRKGLLVLARAYGGLKDTTSEVRTLELCRAKNPKDYVVLTALGDALSKTDNTDDALGAYQQAREINPKYRPAYDGNLHLLEKTGQKYEARTLLHDMLKLFGAEAKIESALCRLFSEDGYIEKAIETCETAIGKDPQNPDNRVNLGLSLKGREDEHAQKEALRILKDAAERFPASEKVQIAAGDLYVENQDYIGAYQYYKRGVTDNPKSIKALLGFANAAFVLQKNEEAMKAFIQACQLNRHEAAGPFQGAIGKLRARKDSDWRTQYQDAYAANCNSRCVGLAKVSRSIRRCGSG